MKFLYLNYICLGSHIVCQNVYGNVSTKKKKNVYGNEYL